MSLTGRRSSENSGPTHIDVESGENDRSEIDDKKRRPSSNPMVVPCATGMTTFGPSTRSPNDLMSSGSRRSSSMGRRLRLLDVSRAPKISKYRLGVYPNVNAPSMREFVSPLMRNSLDLK